MKKALLILLLFPFLLTSCAKTHDSLIEQQISQMEKLTTILNGITDKASADIAKPKMASIKEKMEKIKSKMDELGEPTAEEQAALEKKYGQKMKDATLALMRARLKAGINTNFPTF